MTTLTLASASPARLKTLRAAGVNPQVLVADVDEAAIAAKFAQSTPEVIVAELAKAKLQAVLSAQSPTTDLVLGCDSMLYLDGKLCGKPHSAAVAIARWKEMRAKSGVLYTGHALARTCDSQIVCATAATTVHFADLSDTEISAYVETGEPLHVAGAFTIDALGGAFVERIEGDPHSVVGVSLPLLRSLVRELGFNWFDLWEKDEVAATI